MKAIVGATALVLMAAGGASAATCSVDAVKIGGAAASACSGATDGNPTGNQTNFLGTLNGASSPFGDLGTFTVVDKDDRTGTQAGQLVEADIGSVTGGFSFSSMFETFVITLKAGPEFSAFLFSGLSGDDFTGTFNTQLAGLVNKRGIGQGLSNLVVYGTGEQTPPPPPPPSAVPLPAAGWLMALGLGGLAAGARRKRRAA